MSEQQNAQKTVKTFVLKGNEAKQYNDLMLNLSDLGFCHRLMHENKELLAGKPSDAKMAIWVAVLTKCFCCFQQSDSRRKLAADKIFKGNDSAKQAYSRLSNIRNKHTVHDENNMTQSTAIIQLGAGNADREVKCVIVGGGDAAAHDVAGMELILGVAIAYLENEVAKRGQRLQSQVDAMTTDEIHTLNEWKFDAKAAMFDVDKPRVRLD
jgi:hypothetical protein